MTNSHDVNMINAQAKDITLCKAIEIIELAHRYVGQSNSTRAMDLCAEMKKFIADYRKSQLSDDDPVIE